VFVSPFWLLLLIFLNVLIVTQWYLLGNCVILSVENKLAGESIYNESGIEKSYAIDQIEKYFKLPANSINYTLSLMPFILTFVIIIRLGTQYKITYKKNK